MSKEWMRGWNCNDMCEFSDVCRPRDPQAHGPYFICQEKMRIQLKTKKKEAEIDE